MPNSNQFFSQLPSFPNGNNASGGNVNPWQAVIQNNPGTAGGGNAVAPGGQFGGNWSQVLPYAGGDYSQVTGSHGLFFGNPLYPQLSYDFRNFLASQMGQGATPYPGQVNAPLNPLMQAIQQFYQTGGQQGGVPGMDILQQIAQSYTGIPEAQAVGAAMDRNIAEGRANLKEQFNFAGNLASSPFGTAATDYETQAALQKNALIAQMSEQALPYRTGAAQALMGGGQDVGQYLQGLSQEDIGRLYQEFLRTRPEYSPLLNMEYGLATTFPPFLNATYGTGAAGAALSSAPSLISSIKDLIGTMSGG